LVGEAGQFLVEVLQQEEQHGVAVRGLALFYQLYGQEVQQFGEEEGEALGIVGVVEVLG
jgi:hypothetical protein